MDETSDNADVPPTAMLSMVPDALLAVLGQGEEQPLEIIDDLPRVSEISEAEVDAIERYMSDILDVVLARCQAK